VLTKVGIEQARKLALRLKDEKIDAAYVSDLDRAKDTAEEILLFHPHIHVTCTPLLREASGGVFEGKLGKDLLAEKKASGEPFDTWHPKDGESWVDARTRVLMLLKGVYDEHKNETVLFVSHGGVMTTLLLYLQGKPLDEQHFQQYHPGNTAVSIIEIRGDKAHHFHVLNSTDHLKE